jgi:hypothetical protein
MFQVQKLSHKSDELFITHPDKPLHVMRLANIAELTELHTAISEYLAGQKVGEFIGSAQAQEIARSEGFEIPITSLVNACTRGTIPAAHKKRGRWYMPRANFEAWFQEWKAKQQAK